MSDDEVCELRERVARLDEQVKAADKALLVARAHSWSVVSMVISILSLLVALGVLLKK